MRLLRCNGEKTFSRRKPIGVADGTLQCYAVHHEFRTKSPETELGAHRQELTDMKSKYKYIEYTVVFRQVLILQFPDRMNGE
jgi:hypothetical protein